MSIVRRLRSNGQRKRGILFAIAIGLVLGSVGSAMAMRMDSAGRMSNCQLGAPVDAMCPMNAAAHAEAWQHLFSAPLPGGTSEMLALLALVPFLLVVPRHRFDNASPHIRRLLSEWAFIRPLDPLVEGFSSGRLKPQLYA